MAYKVGQVLFVVLSKGKAQLVPVQVVEEITKKTLRGEIVSYMVRIGGQDDAKTVDVGQIEGEVFDSSVVAKRVLIERSSKAIGKIVEQAVSLAQVWYPGAFEDNNSPADIIDLKTTTALPDEKPEVAAVLEDGTQVRVKLPDSLR